MFIPPPLMFSATQAADLTFIPSPLDYLSHTSLTKQLTHGFIQPYELEQAANSNRLLHSIQLFTISAMQLDSKQPIWCPSLHHECFWPNSRRLNNLPTTSTWITMTQKLYDTDSTWALKSRLFGCARKLPTLKKQKSPLSVKDARHKNTDTDCCFPHHILH